MKKILIAFGTRPEAIKMAPLVAAFKKQKEQYQLKVCVTGQHRELLDQVLDFFEIVPDYDLQLMKDKQELAELSAAVLIGIKGVLEDFPADFLFVHGDTTTSTFAALAGFYAGIKVCHVEAGLRTHHLDFPFPEEANRQLTARIATMHFTPSAQASANLLKEGIAADRIFLTGNTIIDALLFASVKLEQVDYPQIENLKAMIRPSVPVILVTCHRRENFGQGFDEICEALIHIANHQEVQVIYPVHLNPNIRAIVHQRLGEVKNISLIEPLDYPSFIWLMKTSAFIITDSGGVQEEGTALGKHILLMRTHTERPEVVDGGQVQLVGSNKSIIITAAKALLGYPPKHQLTQNLYGIGDSASQILVVLDAWLDADQKNE